MFVRRREHGNQSDEMRESKELGLKKICSLGLKLDDMAAYFSILDCPDGKIRMYYRGKGKSDETHVRESDDGITFSEPRVIWKDSFICHNFLPFIHNGEYYAVGGETDRLSDRKHGGGLYLLHSKDGASWRLVKDEPIITPDHPGFLKAPPEQQGEFDSSISCVQHDGKFYLYFRSNVGRGIRSIQYASSENLIDWPEVRPVRFRPEFNASRGENLYGSYFFNFEGKIMCFIPYFVNGGDGYIGAYEPEAMDMWALTGWFNKETLLPGRVNRSFPVNGSIRSRENPEILYYYVHENYFRAEQDKPVTIDLYIYKKFTRFSVMRRLITKYPGIIGLYMYGKPVQFTIIPRRFFRYIRRIMS